MQGAYCVALIFTRQSYRYKAYALQYTQALLAMQKMVVVFSPDWIELQQELLVKFKVHADKIRCFPLSEIEQEAKFRSISNLSWQYLSLRRQLHQAAHLVQAKIDLVFFAPGEDWIRPNYPKWLLKKVFPFKFSVLLTNTRAYALGALKLNVDPSKRDQDYLLSAETCVGVCTLDRFNTEPLRSRVYRKVLVMPDISDYDLPEEELKMGVQIRKMARGRMIVGAVLLERENPENFLKLALAAPFEQYFFVCVGDFSNGLLSTNCKEMMHQLLISGRDNFYFMLEGERDSKTINSLVRGFDICYVNDGDSHLPHPILSKAAWFKKPVIGSKDETVGKLLQTFKTGIAVNGNLRESIDALQLLRLQMPFEQNFDMSRFKNYAKLQSQDALRQAFEELLWF